MDSTPHIATDEDVFFDYCLYPYTPLGPVAGQYRSSIVLHESFECAGASSVHGDLVAQIQNTLGRQSTVWGCKYVDGVLSWEYYFYNYKKSRDDVTVSHFLEFSAPFVTCDIRPREDIPYFMFSVDIDDRCLREARIEGVNLYVLGEHYPSGLSYLLSPDGYQFRNHYTFYQAGEPDEMQHAEYKLRNSGTVDFSSVPLKRVLWPALRECHTICVANKRFCDGVYFSRIDVDQFAHFLAELDYPASMRSFVNHHKSRLCHLRFDVGFDYRQNRGEFEIVRSGFYGTF